MNISNSLMITALLATALLNAAAEEVPSAARTVLIDAGSQTQLGLGLCMGRYFSQTHPEVHYWLWNNYFRGIARQGTGQEKRNGWVDYWTYVGDSAVVICWKGGMRTLRKTDLAPFAALIKCLSVNQQSFLISLHNIVSRYHRILVLPLKNCASAVFDSLPEALRQLLLQERVVQRVE